MRTGPGRRKHRNCRLPTDRNIATALMSQGMFSLDGRVALITGGAAGLGKLFGETLADFGADIAIADIDEATARQTAGLIEGRGRRVLWVKADVSCPDQVQRMVDATVSCLGTSAILVINAGITAKGYRIADMPV